MYVYDSVLYMNSYLAPLTTGIYFCGSVLESVVRFTLGVDLARFRFHCNPN